MNEDGAFETLLDTCARFLESEGVPRLGGRIYGAVLLSSGPISLDQMAEVAGASKASASSNARLLERLGLIEKVSVSAERRDHYRTASSGVVAALGLVWGRIRTLRDLYALAARPESAAPPEVRNRLRLDGSFLDHVLATGDDLTSQWLERTRGF